MSAASLALPAAVRMPGHPRGTAEAVPERASRCRLHWGCISCLVVVASYLQELDQEVRAAPTGATSSAAAAAEEARNAPIQQAARLVRGPGYLYTDAPKTATRNLVTPQYIITERSRKFVPTSLAPHIV